MSGNLKRRQLTPSPMPVSKEEMRAKADATRLKNLRIRLAHGPALTPLDRKILKGLEAKLGVGHVDSSNSAQKA
jgi:hypothetical protein